MVSGSAARRPSPRRRALACVVVLLGVGLVPIAQATAADPSPCPGLNAIVCENARPGTPQSVWDVRGAGDAGLQGFSTDISYNVGDTAQFKIKTDASVYTVDIYRLGWYGGNGARKVESVTPSAALPQVQPACASDPSTGLYDCGTWGVSAGWQIPPDAVSGVYVAKLTDPANADTSHITFIVRNDASRSDVVFQTSDPSWQAYNSYGGANFYQNVNGFTGTGKSRAFKVSYNRPLATRGASNGRDALFANEFPMLQFLERNGYDVSYISGLDTSRNGSLLLNHKTFVSTGHDEYWSGAQRANVEAARDAGVNLAFFSGNEMYWRTRWEPSIDGSSAANRTLVSYKETWSNAKVDPSNEWTGTWRDPRFATSAQGGGLPENGLTGTAYKSNFTDLPITVQQDEGKFRLWRNTGLSTMAGASTPLAEHTIGYESDEDLDNGFRPAGLVRLSTTTGPTPQYLQDYGNTVAPGTTTHHLTLYRAASGALVFGAGTVQWAWGLSSNHDGAGAPADPRMQQATINLLADMGAQASTLMSGMVTAAPSADTTGPTTAISSPAEGQAIANGTEVTTTGTSSDVGGRVAGVEVSTNGGVTWHPAEGRDDWSYTYIQSGNGASSVRVRATDDSANIGPIANLSVAVSCPCSLFGNQIPSVTSTTDTTPVELGVRFQASRDGYVSAVRFYKGTTNTGVHTGSLWSTSGTRLATGTFVNETATGWQILRLPSPVPVTSGTTYVASYYAPNGGYAADPDYFTPGNHVQPPLQALGRPNMANGVFVKGPGFPTRTYSDTNYWADVLFSETDTSPPAVTGQQPNAGATSVASGVAPTATFGGAITASSLSFTLTASDGTMVSGAVTYDATARTAKFVPQAPLSRGSRYVASVSAVSAAGVAMAQPVTWAFTVAQPTPPPGACPCSLWDDAATPAVIAASDTKNVELGVKFTADADGSVTGVRFYKGPTNVGTHTGSLWSSAGVLLATATFSGESSTGWQTVTFSANVPVTAGTTYTASYRAPVGRYSVDSGAFGTSGKDSPPLHVAKGSAVYTYGTGAPTLASSSNYWVDVVYNYNDAAPVVTAVTPSSGASNVVTSATASGTFAAGIQAGSASIALSAADGTAVPGATAFSGATRTITLTPSGPLSPANTYTATISGARSMSGTVMAPFSWTFTTAGACPCTLFASDARPNTLDSGDTKSVEVGVKFTPTSDGQITGMRFYKTVANTGTHVGTVWTSAGARLASATFIGETASGWQTATFATPVNVNAGTTLVVSYLAPAGRYSSSGGFFATTWSNGVLSAPAGTNGVYAYGSGGFPASSYKSTNYWVDPVFVRR